MEVLIAIIVGVVFTIAVYLMLSRNIIRVVLGAVLLSDGYHLLLLMMTGLQNGAAPFLNIGEDTFVDPVPQALILTSIVISFGVTAFLLALSYRLYKEHTLDDLEELKEVADE